MYSFRCFEYAKCRETCGLPVAPQLSWFDVDAALYGPKASWFFSYDEDVINEVVESFKKVNRFLFMTSIMESEEDNHTQAGIPVGVVEPEPDAVPEGDAHSKKTRRKPSEDITTYAITNLSAHDLRKCVTLSFRRTLRACH